MPTGQCICGQLKYEYSGDPVMKAICHCLTCRHLSGSAFTTNILVPEDKFKVTSGTPKTYATTQDSGMTLTYSFCGNCGCNVSKIGDGEAFRGVVIIQAGSLDDIAGIENAEPGAELYVSRRVSWLPALAGKGQVQEFPARSFVQWPFGDREEEDTAVRIMEESVSKSVTEDRERYLVIESRSRENVPAMNERTPLISTVRVERRPGRFPHSTLRRFCTVALASSLIAILVCFLLPVAILPRGQDSPSSYLPWSRPFPKSWPQSAGISFKELQDLLLNTPDENHVRAWSEYYTAGPHLAGKNLSQALWTRERWEEFGVKSEIVAYDVYINYPVSHRLALLHGDKVKYECSLEEDVIDEDPTTSLKDRIPTFHGYSASGNVTAPFVYVNFGTYQDFEDLLAANVSLSGKIALAKYGKVFRGLKVKRAQELGMIGVAIYSDPQEDGEMTEENGHKPYPEGPARNPSSVQRGSTQYISTLPGDPTTPGYPSKPGVPRVDPGGSIPKIPSLPISYADALPLLKALNGHGPNASSFDSRWHGGGLGYKGVDYNIGPSPKSVVLNLVNEQEYVTTPLWNVIGVINGTVPDEVVVLGNHRDAWIAGGAGDPNSGSAALNEVIRSFGEALKAGWKPFRTIVFASWDGEEYGLVGSTEWVEEFLPWLSASTVAYLNVDVGSRGKHFEAAASPLLNKLIYNVTGTIPSPNQTTQGQTVGDVWDGKIRTMGSGSDFTAFQDFAGIPSLDLGFGSGPNDPVYHYHSNYDSFHWMDTYGDKDWHYHVTITKIWALLAAQLSETAVLPLSAKDYAKGLEIYLDDVKERSKEYRKSSTFSFHNLDKATTKLIKAASHFDIYTSDLKARLGEDVPWWKWWKKVKLYYEVRKANFKYKMLERQFLFVGGLDNRTWFKHVVFAPGRWTGYAGATYPGLVESFEDGNMTNAHRWSGIIEERLQAATKLLE